MSFLADVRADGGTSLDEGLGNYAKRARESGLVVVVSDLLDPAGYERGVRALLERRFDVHLVHLLDPEEMNPSLGGDLRLIDSEIELVACGSSNSSMPTFGSWESTVLEECYETVDYVSLHAYYETWATRGVRAWEESWWTMAADLGDLVAPLIGAEPGSVVFQPNVTLAHAVILSGLDFHGPRRRIVTDAMHFPSIRYLLANETASRGADVVTVPSDDGIVRVDSWPS